MNLGEDCIGLSVFAIVSDDEGRILLVMHKPSEKKGKEYEGVWAMPGGKIEFGEGTEDALAREIKEETNVDISEIKLISHSDSIKDNGRKHWIALNFTANALTTDAKVMEAEKFEDVQFFDSDKIPKNLSKFCRENLQGLGLIE